MGSRTRPIRFVAVGILNTAFGYSVYAVLLWIGAHYGVAAAGATVLGVLFNFKSTGLLVFDSTGNSRFFRFVGVYVAVYIAQVLGITALRSAGVDAYTAGLLLVPPLAAMSYFLCERFAFAAR